MDWIMVKTIAEWVLELAVKTALVLGYIYLFGYMSKEV
jgi:hypothetical protein